MKFLHNLFEKKKTGGATLHCCENTCLADESLCPSSFQGPLCESLHRDALHGGWKCRHQRCSQPIGQSSSMQTKHLVVVLFSPTSVGDHHSHKLWCTDLQLNQTVIYSRSTNHCIREPKGSWAWIGFLPL